MNRREKTLIGAMGAILVLFAARTVKNQYVAKLDSLDAEIQQKQQDQQKIEADLRRLKLGKQTWAELGRQTLATDENEGATLFRPDIDALAQSAGLKKSSVQIRGTNKIGKNGFRALSCTATAEGQLSNILTFLFKLHQKPYLIRCETVKVDRKTDKNTPPNTLKLTADLTTLLMPDSKDCGLPRVVPVDLTSQPAAVITRSKFAHVDDYLEIVKRKVFETWTPPVPPPGKVAGLVPTPNGQLDIRDPQMRWSQAAYAKSYVVYFGDTNPPPEMTRLENSTSYRSPRPLEEGKKYYWRVDSINSENVRTQGDVVSFTGYKPVTPPPPPPAKQPPPDANLVLARIVSSPRGQEVVLEDPRNKNAEDKRVEVGDTLYGGTLVLVSTKGAVSEKEGTLYFHELTKTLRECVPLTEETQPALLEEVMKLEHRAAGISQNK